MRTAEVVIAGCGAVLINVAVIGGAIAGLAYAVVWVAHNI